MPDLTNSPIGGKNANGNVGTNYRRALADFSRFGTRKLVLYTITVYGLSDATIDQIYADEERYDADGNTYPSEWIESSGSILEAIQRGVQLVAEPYAYGDWNDYNEGPNYNDISITAIVASDTVEDNQEQGDIVPANPNSYTLETAILDAISNFSYDGVEVRRAHLVGWDIWTSGYAMSRTRGGDEASRERWAARLAQGKAGLTRRTK